MFLIKYMYVQCVNKMIRTCFFCIFYISGNYSHINVNIGMLLVRLDIDLPVNGEYALEIYANDPERDGNTYTHACQYLLVKPPAGDNSAATFYQTPAYQDCYNVHGMQEPLQPVSMSLEQLARGKTCTCLLQHGTPC